MIDERQNLSLLVSLQWQDTLATYKDCYFILKTNFWRDFYPPMFDYQIKRAQLNQTLTIPYKAGELIESEFSPANLKTIRISQFNRFYSGPIAIEPTIGRYYPRGMIEGVADCFKMDNRPFRVLNKTKTHLDIDLNHPLAPYPLKLKATITDVFDANQQNGGRCNDIAESITINGPGFQTPLEKTPFDFSQGMPFLRKIEEDDATFYQAIDTTPSVDRVAIEQLTEFYSPYLKENSSILDVMASSDSYIPKTLKNVTITGLGLKEDDLIANTQLNQYTLHDLNKNTTLPYDDQSFDTVLCSFGIEYITQPIKLFKEIARILKPSGHFLIGFSDRFYKQKAIGLWADLHEFERMGIVLEYFRQSKQFSELYSESIRGLIRHDDDPFKNKTVHSCPMFMLSGKKI
jgi:SAM-dependent methyltransferase